MWFVKYRGAGWQVFLSADSPAAPRPKSAEKPSLQTAALSLDRSKSQVISFCAQGVPLPHPIANPAATEIKDVFSAG